MASGDSAASEGGVVGCISPPTGPAIDAAFCSAFAAISSRCNACADCQKENAASCATFGDQLSIPFRNAIVACSDEIDCAAFETQVQLVQDPCVAAYVFDAGPSSYQLAAKTAYCDNCADASVNGAQNCASFFGQPDASGIGTVVLFGSDIVSGDIANGCPF
ncbi:MAG: hypothetical protein ACREJX_08940, partial [Polyangiaceae bacterium]